jgi:hypothetical protein
MKTSENTYLNVTQRLDAEWLPDHGGLPATETKRQKNQHREKCKNTVTL